jgi:uncharacterized glyoxalase superfamily protein PhnB
MHDDWHIEQAIPRFAVSDIDTALAFYQQKLGFACAFRYPDYAGVAKDGVELHVWKCPSLDLARHVSTCRIHVVGVDALYEYCALGGVVHPESVLADQPWGFREFTAIDPWGNAIVFGEAIPSL